MYFGYVLVGRWSIGIDFLVIVKQSRKVCFKIGVLGKRNKVNVHVKVMRSRYTYRYEGGNVYKCHCFVVNIIERNTICKR